MSIEEQFRSDLTLSQLSTFGIGGKIRYYLEAKGVASIEESMQWAREKRIPYFVLGRGSNCLFDDRGFDGLVIHNRVDFCTFDASIVSVGAGYPFSLLGVQTARRNLSGLEFASGIPGTVGGAIYMNAGANGRETHQPLLDVLFLHESGEKKTYAKSDLTFAYRHSTFQEMRGCILSARFQLEPKEGARKSQIAILETRIKTQPYSDKSAGCIFRNPSPDLSAGALIDRCGLKGLANGGAKVSEKHANFIVNTDHSTAAHVAALIADVQRKVMEKTGIWLEPEVRQVPPS